MADVVRRDELAFLDIDDAAGAPSCNQQIGLAAEERRDLQDIDDFGGGPGLRWFVDIRQDGDTQLRAARRECAGLPSDPGPR